MISSPACTETFSTEKQDFNTEVILDSLDHPWGMDFLPDGRLLITKRAGTLLLVSLDPLQTTTIDGLPEISEHGQGGLLDVLVHPAFEHNQVIFLSMALGDDGIYGTEVIRARLDGKNLVGVETIFSALPKVKGKRHFGSRLVMDESGYLLISLGDRGQREQAQRLDSHLGSLIRLHEDGRIPSDNPYVETPDALPEIFSHGHRNIQGMTIRQADQSLWTHEHGPQGGDELNFSKAGANYGWPVITYGANYGIGTKIGDGTHKDGMEQPVYYWIPSIAPSGMAFYEAGEFPEWQDNLFIGSLKFDTLVRLELDDDKVVNEERLLTGKFGRIRDVQIGPDGLVYLLKITANWSGYHLTRIES